MNKKANNITINKPRKLPAIYGYRLKNRSNSDLHCYMTVNKKERKSSFNIWFETICSNLFYSLFH